MSHLRNTIDLDHTDRTQWKVETDSLYIFQSKLWNMEKVGCLLCVAGDYKDPLARTLVSTDDCHEAVCLTHGSLKQIECKIRKDYTVTIGSTVTTGFQELNELIWMPTSLSNEEQSQYINRLIDQAMADLNQDDIEES